MTVELIETPDDEEFEFTRLSPSGEVEICAPVRYVKAQGDGMVRVSVPFRIIEDLMADKVRAQIIDEIRSMDSTELLARYATII